MGTDRETAWLATESFLWINSTESEATLTRYFRPRLGYNFVMSGRLPRASRGAFMALSMLTLRFVMSPVCCGIWPPLPGDQSVPFSQTPQFVHVIRPELFPFAVNPALRLWNEKQSISSWGALPPDARLAGLPSLNPFPSPFIVAVGPG